MLQKRSQRPCLFAVHGLFREGFLKGASQIDNDHGRECADEERNAPSPCLELLRRENRLENDQDKQSAELTRDDREILKGSVKTTVSFGGNLTEVGRSRP